MLYQTKDLTDWEEMLHKIMKKLSLPDTSHLPNGCVIKEMVKCGKLNCHCSYGLRHGPYSYLIWREDGRLRKRYLKPLDALAYSNSSNMKRKKRTSLNPHLMQLGYYEHKSELRSSRRMKTLEREDKRYDLFKEAIQAQFGYPITKEEYLAIYKKIISERKRRNRLGLPWKSGLVIEID